MGPIKKFIVQCLKPNCGFRYLSPLNEKKQSYCVKCGSPTRITPFFPDEINGEKQNNFHSHHLEILCDNIRSGNNLGSIFRTSDGAGISHIHICGITPAPDHPSVQKTALGAEKTVPWTQSWNALETAHKLKENQFALYALENSRSSISLFEIEHYPSRPVVLIVGNEENGVDPELLDLCDLRIYIPMLGIKSSLNVSVAFGIAAYTLMFLDDTNEDSQ